MVEYVNKDRYVYCKITEAMYSLVQTGRISNLDLMKHLEPHRYYSSKCTPVLWFHKTWLIDFILVVDNFGIKYINKKDIERLLKALKERCLVNVD